ncbi:MAG: putative Rossmann fold enzyme [Natronomonas sp.]|jgi:uncharacterized Rossmann fold enzyme|uniref:6-hydroxymethylpterin diphosphokinase MptE-like protein n=1 Tax=Natronomonas sp. TaxID=2184060 RepID=UPI0039895381
MLYTDWEPIYAAILADFGYDQAGDERARDLLAALVSEADTLGLADIEFDGTVAVCGAGPTLSEELALAERADSVVAASTAADTCLDAGIAVDCMVTDLDKNPETARNLTREGVPVAAHAHGDNLAAIERCVPEFTLTSVLPTTQAAPKPPVCNPGGFTDGDRAAFLADARGADRLVFPGWEFDDPTVSPEKAKKLRWAERLLALLEERRGERFAVLDGRRDDIDFPWTDA